MLDHVCDRSYLKGRGEPQLVQTYLQGLRIPKQGLARKIFITSYNARLRSKAPRARSPKARVVKLVDAGDSKSPAARRAGSIPAPGTSKIKHLRVEFKIAFFCALVAHTQSFGCTAHLLYARLSLSRSTQLLYFRSPLKMYKILCFILH